MVKRSLHSSGRSTCDAPAHAPADAPAVQAQPRAARQLVIAGSGLIAVTYGVVRFGYGLQLTQLAAEFSLSPGTSGLIASGSFAAYCLTALVARQVIDRRGGRQVLWFSATLAAVGAVIVSLAWTTPVLALGILVAGSAAGAASPSLVTAVSTTSPEALIDRRQAVVNSGTGIGVAAAGVLALLNPTAWRPVWVAAAVGALLTAAVVDRRTTWPSPRNPRDDHSIHPVSPSDMPGGRTETRRMLLRPVLAATLAGLGSAAVWTFGRDLLTTVGRLPEHTTAVLWILLGATAVLGALSGDAVRVLGLRRAWVLTVTLAAVSTGLLAAGADVLAAAGAATVIFGGSYTALSGVLIAWAGQLRPHLVGATTATFFIALTAGQAAGSLLTGSLMGLLGPQPTFLACAVMLLAAALVVLPRGRSKPDRT